MLLMLAWPFLGRWVRQQGKQGSPALNSQEQESMGAGSWSEALVGKGQTSLAPPAPGPPSSVIIKEKTNQEKGSTLPSRKSCHSANSQMNV